MPAQGTIGMCIACRSLLTQTLALQHHFHIPETSDICMSPSQCLSLAVHAQHWHVLKNHEEKHFMTCAGDICAF